MTYVGNPIDTQNTFQSLVGKRFNGDGSTTDFTLDVAPSSTLDIEVFVGNVRQDPNSAYTLSGTTLSFTGAPPSGTNNIYVVHQAKSVGTIDVPALGVSTASIQADAITEAKIADDAVESEHLNNNIVSGQTELAAIPAQTDEFILSDAGTLQRIDFSLINGSTDVDYWYFSNNQSISALSATVVSGHWARQTSYGGAGGELGSGLTESSGVFTFPSTGIYYVRGWFRLLRDGDSRYTNLALQVTLDNSSYNDLSLGTGFIKQVSGGNTTAIVDVDGIIDVTDTSNVKFKFQLTARQDVTINGAAYSMTGMTAVRLGAT